MRITAYQKIDAAQVTERKAYRALWEEKLQCKDANLDKLHQLEQTHAEAKANVRRAWLTLYPQRHKQQA